MIGELLLFSAGLVLLAFGAEAMVRGASRLALSLGISPLVVGLTVVAFGTSAPEIAVAVDASLSGKPSLAIGNVIGSNVANILLILGLSAVIAPLLVAEQIVRQEVPVMIAASVLMVAMAIDGSVSRIEAAMLLALSVGYTAFLTIQARKASARMRQEVEAELPPSADWDRHWSVQVLLVLAGLAMLVAGANWLVEAAVTFARALGVSDLVIGLTVVAIGTSMPEIATSMAAALRGQRDIAVGNVVGSNLFNILACLGAAGLVSPVGLDVPEAARSFDLWVMLAVTFVCIPIFFTRREIRRWEGAMFLGYYAAYTTYLILSAQEHEALPMFSGVMLLFVLPLTGITIGVSVWRHFKRPRPIRS